MARHAALFSAKGVEPPEASTTEAYCVQIITSLNQLQSLATAWNNLLLDSGVNTLFLSWEWLFAWANCFINSDRSLFILAVYHADVLVGLAPFYIHQSRRKLVTLREIRFLGSPETGSDYLDVIIRKGREKAAAEAIYDFLFNQARHQWDELRLTDIPAESMFLTHFMNRVEENGKFFEVQRCAVMPQTKLPNDMDIFCSMLSANRREIFRRDMRRLNRESNVEHCTYCADGYEDGLTRFFKLYNLKSGHTDTKIHTFLNTLGTINDSKHWLQIDILSAGNTDIAGLVHLLYENKLSMLLMVVDKQFNRKISLGNLLVGRCIQNAINDGIRLYDFLKGGEEYKFHWSSNTRASLSVILDQHHLPSILATISRLGKYAVKTILR